jgi:hypothetical protein
MSATPLQSKIDEIFKLLFLLNYSQIFEFKDIKELSRYFDIKGIQAGIINQLEED